MLKKMNSTRQCYSIQQKVFNEGINFPQTYIPRSWLVPWFQKKTALIFCWKGSIWLWRSSVWMAWRRSIPFWVSSSHMIDSLCRLTLSHCSETYSDPQSFVSEEIWAATALLTFQKNKNSRRILSQSAVHDTQQYPLRKFRNPHAESLLFKWWRSYLMIIFDDHK